MKRYLLTLAGFALAATLVHSQIINGGFENWTTTIFDNPAGYGTSNPECWNYFSTQNATKVTDSQHLTYAIKLETKISGNDTGFAYFYNGDPKGQGGVPFPERPTSLTGYYKGTLQTNDSAGVWVILKKNGVVISNNLLAIGTSTSTYTQFTLNMNYTSGLTPDTLILACISSNFMRPQYAKNGSFVLFDNFSFNGVGSQPNGFNGSFENWTQTIIDEPTGWDNSNADLSRDGIPGNAIKTTDKYEGSYALQLVSTQAGGSWIACNLTNGKFAQQSYGGVPYTGTQDTLLLYYKYTAVGSDSGTVYVNLSKNGSSVGGGYQDLPATGAYTLVKVPFSAFMTPDTLRIDFSSSKWPYNSSNIGSSLTIDDLKLKSTVGMNKLFSKKTNLISIYPNPANQFLNIRYNSANSEIILAVYDILGNKVQSVAVSGNMLSNYKHDISSLNAGSYFIEITDNNTKMTTKFSVVK